MKKDSYSTVQELYSDLGLEYLAFYNCEKELKQQLMKKSKSLYYKQQIDSQVLWHGQWYRDNILQDRSAPVIIKWIDNSAGWGVFAQKDLYSGDYISFYNGVIRPRGWFYTPINSYCFTYPLQPLSNCIGLGWTIDAYRSGNLSRFINHSDEPNCITQFAYLYPWPYILIIADRDIKSGEQLTYDYGSGYWKHKSKRKLPSSLSEI